MPSDDSENEPESYAIVSAEGIEYQSTETVSDIVFQIHELVHGKKRDLGMLRSLTEDLWSLVAVNDDTMVSDTLDVLDLPAGWTSEADEEDDGE